MTGPVENITVRCPACGAIYEDWHRGSLNLDLDSFQRGLHSLRHDRDVPGVRARRRTRRPHRRGRRLDGSLMAARPA